MHKPNGTYRNIPEELEFIRTYCTAEVLHFQHMLSMPSERYVLEQQNTFVVFCSACVQLHQRLFDRKTTCDFYSSTIHLAAHPTTHRKSDTRASITDKQTSHYALPGEKKNIAEIDPK